MSGALVPPSLFSLLKLTLWHAFGRTATHPKQQRGPPESLNQQRMLRSLICIVHDDMRSGL